MKARWSLAASMLMSMGISNAFAAPKSVQPAKPRTQFVDAVDLAPTLLHAAGTSFAPAIDGAARYPAKLAETKARRWREARQYSTLFAEPLEIFVRRARYDDAFTDQK